MNVRTNSNVFFAFLLFFQNLPVVAIVLTVYVKNIISISASLVHNCAKKVSSPQVFGMKKKKNMYNKIK